MSIISFASKVKKNNILLPLFLILSYNLSFAQNKISSLQLSIGKSWHGTGDLNGIIVEAAYENYFIKRLSFSNALTTTIHYKRDKGFNDLIPNISPANRLLHFTTAGLQTTSLLHYTILELPNHKFRVDGGLILRFQSSTYPEQYRYVQDPNIYEEPFYVIYESGRQNIFSVGYCTGLSYLVNVCSKYQIGLRALFQNDTNADAITQMSITFSRLLNLKK